TPTYAAMVAAGFIWVLTAVNVWGIRTAGHVQVVTTILKVLPLILIAAAGFTRFDPAPFVIVETGVRTIAAKLAGSATLTFWAFGGLESATIPADAIDRPERTIPRATIVGTALAAVLYIV